MLILHEQTVMTHRLPPATLLGMANGSFLEERSGPEQPLNKDSLAFVVHDLRAPLTAIRGYAQLIQRAISRGDSRQLESFARHIDDETRRMDEALLNALEASRLETAILPLRPEATDLVALIQDLAEAFRRSANRDIDVEAEPAQLICQGDEARLRRALTNVLENAIKYSPPSTEVAVRLWAEAGNHTALISVADYGIGIPDDDIAKVFQAGYRATNAAAEAGGSGLGLASVRDIVEQHGGRVLIESSPGRGTTLTVSLPMGQPKGVSLPVLARASSAAFAA
jgi:signal transduction histidine kinase